MIHITLDQATRLIADVYYTLLNGTESFDEIGVPLAYLLGGIALLANSPNQGEDCTVFSAIDGECNAKDLVLIKIMEELFDPDNQVWKFIRKQNRDPQSDAEHACRLIVAAYKAGHHNGGSVDWSDVDEAYVAACRALGIDPNEEP